MIRAIALGLRALALTALLVAPWAPSIPVPDDTRTTVFVLDRSESVGASARELADQFVAEAEDHDPRARVGVVEFAGSARVIRWPSGPARSAPALEDEGTDLASAVRLAAAVLPESGRRRLVLLTDGRATTGGVDAAVEQARARGVEVDAVALDDAGPGDARLTDVTAVQDRVAPGEPFEATARLTGPPSTVETVVWSRDGLRVHSETVTFDEDGHATSRLRDPSPPPGAHVYEASAGVTLERVFAHVADEPRVLVVTLTGRESPSLLLHALNGAGRVNRHSLQRGPVTPAQLEDVDLVVLTDLPLEQPGTATHMVSGLDVETQRALLEYVSEHGGGLIVGGGAFGFGPDWADAPISRLLPVTIEDQGELQDPPVAIAMMLDTSGSMGMRVGGYTKIRLAAEGCLAAASTLRSEDRIAIASVEEDTRWVQPLTVTAALDTDRVRRLGAGGGGIYVYTGLRDAYGVLDEALEPIRHVLLFSDTQDSEQQSSACVWPPCATTGHTAIELATAARARGITTTVVGIGDAAGIHSGFLAELAAAGGGRYYVTETGADLRHIFVAETRAVARSNLREEDTPIVADGHPLLDGVGQPPPLAGFVQTRRRPTAHTALSTEAGRPILATWRYGVGTVVAYTSDLGGRWSNAWSEWERSPQLFRQMVRHAMRRRTARADLDVSLSARGVEVTLDVTPGTELEPDALSLEAFDARARPRELPVELERVGPDRYRARARTEGQPIVVARLRDPEGHVLAEASAQDASHSEHAGVGADRRALRELARLGGGRLVESPEALASTPPPSAPGREPAWPWLLLLAAALVVADLWVRRLGGPTRRVALAGLAPPADDASPAAPASDEALSEAA